MKKRVLMFCFSLFLFSAFVSANGSKETTAKDDVVTIKWYVVGSMQPTDWDEIKAELDAMSIPDIGVALDLVVVPWGDYASKMAVTVAAGDEFDLAFTSNWMYDYGTYVGKDAFIPLDDLISEYGSDYVRYVPEKIRNATKVNGKTYGMLNYQLSYLWENKSIDAETAEQAGFDPFSMNILEDFEPYFDWILENRPDMYLWDQFASDYKFDYHYLYYGLEAVAGLQVPGAVRLNDKDLNIINQFETEEFEAYCRLMKKWSDKGYIKPDQISIQDREALTLAGLVAVSSANRYSHVIRKMGEPRITRHIDGGRPAYYREAFPSSSNPFLQTGSIQGTITAVSQTSRHPEKAVEFFNYLYSNKKYLDMLGYGLEGTHYTIDAELNEHIIKTDIGMNHPTSQILWELGPANIKAITSGTETRATKDGWLALNESAEASNMLGFVFDTSNVLTELTGISSVIDEYYNTLMFGFGNVEENLANFRVQLNKAGAKKIISEMQSQIETWKVTQ